MHTHTHNWDALEAFTKKTSGLIQASLYPPSDLPHQTNQSELHLKVSKCNKCLLHESPGLISMPAPAPILQIAHPIIYVTAMKWNSNHTEADFVSNYVAMVTGGSGFDCSCAIFVFKPLRLIDTYLAIDWTLEN